MPFNYGCETKTWPIFARSTSYCFSLHRKIYFERWVFFEATRNTIQHDFRAVLRSDVSVHSRIWQSVYGCNVVYASRLMKLSVINRTVFFPLRERFLPHTYYCIPYHASPRFIGKGGKRVVVLFVSQGLTFWNSALWSGLPCFVCCNKQRLFPINRTYCSRITIKMQYVLCVVRTELSNIIWINFSP
jgi:hypothetical protein